MEIRRDLLDIEKIKLPTQARFESRLLELIQLKGLDLQM